jgi:hypothetical protein
MAIFETTSTRLVLKSGSTTLSLDKATGKVTLQRKLLLWQRKPIEAPISDVADALVDAAVDRASGVEVCHTMVILRTGQGWALPTADKKEAQVNATAIRQFLGLGA